MLNKNIKKGAITIYRSRDGKISLEVKLEKETLWLTQKQISVLFAADRTVIGRHLRNIFNTKELGEECNVQKMHIAFSDKPVKFYSLDAIISVGYRVNSRRATQFRVWATGVLRKHLIEGFTINETRLLVQKRKFEDLKNAIKLIQNVRVRKELEYKEISGLLDVISDYSYALSLLDDYDYKRLSVSSTSKKEKFTLDYESARKAVCQLKKKFSTSALFGVEKDNSFKSSVSAIYHTFNGKDLYPSVEEKAAHLLYFIVKNHSFVDGNKRIAASIFLWFLERNGLLYKEDGSKRIADNALVALALMIAESNPRDRDVIVTLVVNLINKNN